MLADPSPNRGGFETGSTHHVVRVPAGIRRRAHVILRGTVERVARQDRRVTVWLREHPDIGEPKRLAITIADAALMLRVMVLEEHDRLIRGHHSPRLRRELISRRAVRVQL